MRSIPDFRLEPPEIFLQKNLQDSHTFRHDKYV